jgi:hypothetical protein
MPLTEKERQAAHAVVERFQQDKEPTTHQKLLSEVKDPTLINRLTNAQVFNADVSSGNPKYFPTILTFCHSGDDQFLNAAKKAVEVVIRDAKSVFMTNYDQSRRYEVPTFIAQLESSNYVPVPEQITLGLFLSKDVPGTIVATLDENKTNVISFQINEHILNQDPEKTWDNYVQANDRIAQEDSVKAIPRQDRGTPVRPVAQPRPKVSKPSKAHSWLPSRWKIEEHLGEGGQGWTYKVRRSTGSDQQVYVLKRLKNKERLHRFQQEIAALKKLDHPGILRIVETAKDSEQPFFVSEFCDGPDLSKANLSGVDFPSRLRIFRQVCDAIAAAHNASILHRDLKPSNQPCVASLTGFDFCPRGYARHCRSTRR